MKQATHEIKCLTKYYQAIDSGEKTFEIRKNDRDYRVYDHVVLCEIVGPDCILTGRRLVCKIIYILEGGRFGLEKGYVAMSITKGM